MALHHVISALPEGFDQACHDKRNQPHDSGYNNSTNSKHQMHDRDADFANEMGDMRPWKKNRIQQPFPPQYLCGTCTTHFKGYSDLARHLKVSSTTCAESEGHWKCGRCGKQFTKGKSLTRHINSSRCTTSVIRPSHDCQICGSTHSRKDNLDRHTKECHGKSRRKTANAITVPPLYDSVKASAQSSSHDSIAESRSLASAIPSFEVGCDTTDPPPTRDISLDSSLDACQPSSSIDDPKSSAPLSESPELSTTSSSRSTVRGDDVLRQDGSHIRTPPSAKLPDIPPQKASWTLPSRPKHASRRPGPTRKLVFCPSCRQNVGASHQELVAHAEVHSGGRFSPEQLCCECMICFERSEDFHHHLMSVQKYGDCGFLKHDKKCGGHHPPADGEFVPNPNGDHARMLDAVTRWQVRELQDQQYRHDAIIKDLQNQGEDSERWTLGASSARARSFWSQKSKPVSKKSAPSRIDYMSKMPFRTLAERMVLGKLTASRADNLVSRQRSHRKHLAIVGSIMHKDLYALENILRNGQDPNERLRIVETIARNICYDEKLSGKHSFMSPLILASEQGFLGAMDMLICAGADVNAVDDNYRSALDWAMIRSNTKACGLLLARGARYVERGDQHADDPHMFLQTARCELIPDLIWYKSHLEHLRCYDHHALLTTDPQQFRELLSRGFSVDSTPLCTIHSRQSFRDLAQSVAPHLLELARQFHEQELNAERLISGPEVPGYKRFEIEGCNLRWQSQGEMPAALKLAFTQYTDIKVVPDC